MDQRTQELAFLARKVLRYARVYGLARTWIKIRSHFHMKKRYAAPPAFPEPPKAGGHVGIIGCGNFSFSTIAYYLRKNYGNVIRCSMDCKVDRAASLFRHYRLRYYTDDSERVISDPLVGLVFVASNHASHAEYAIRALEAGKCVHIEKPHVVNEDQLVRLCRAMNTTSGRVGLGFNRPMSRLGRSIRHHLSSQSGPAVFNWFVAGHELPLGHWYLKPGEGGRVVGNLCHWTDFVYQLMDRRSRYPITITPTHHQEYGSTMAVTYRFGDGTIATITFFESRSFEGVRESFGAHRRDLLLWMTDFERLTVEVLDKKRRMTSLFRDQGHEARIQASYELTGPRGKRRAGSSVDYVWETGELFLKTKKALDTKSEIIVHPFDESRLGTTPPKKEDSV